MNTTLINSSNLKTKEIRELRLLKLLNQFSSPQRNPIQKTLEIEYFKLTGIEQSKELTIKELNHKPQTQLLK